MGDIHNSRFFKISVNMIDGPVFYMWVVVDIYNLKSRNFNWILRFVCNF